MIGRQSVTGGGVAGVVASVSLAMF